MSIDAMNWAKKIKTGKSSAKAVLTWLADMCGPDHCTFPSIGALADATELDKKTVQSSLQHLIAVGLIEDTGDRRGRTNQIPVYRLVGIEESVPDVERTQKREHYQKRDRLKKPVNKPKNGNVTENGIVKEKAPENGVVTDGETIPFLEGNDPENGIRNLSGILKPKNNPPIAPQTDQLQADSVSLAGEVLDFLNSKINGRTPKRADTLREIIERLTEGHTVGELNLVAEHRASQLLSNPALGHMLSARMIFDPTRFGGYVRLRDAGMPCISCGATPAQKFGGTMDCGHYRTRGSAAHLTFNLHNTAAQCVRCNRDQAGAQKAFEQGLIIRIGPEKVEAINNDNRPRTFTKEYYQRIKSIFTRKARRLEKRRANQIEVAA